MFWLPGALTAARGSRFAGARPVLSYVNTHSHRWTVLFPVCTGPCQIDDAVSCPVQTVQCAQTGGLWGTCGQG